ncbi:MAG: hypothetical protein K8W52_09435 [Deltaproteobacteria bacterium]|nr:hypothetical protein [Deltaproteobacteria bacterium]
MFPYIETAIAFALVMLVGSLMVNVIVRILSTLRGQRPDGVQDMLVQLHRGFCAERGVALATPERLRAERAFVDGVLGAPVLHAPDKYDDVLAYEARCKEREAALRAEAAKATDAARAKLLADAEKVCAQVAAMRAKNLNNQIEHIRKGDLLAIIRGASHEVPGVPGVRTLPAAWFGNAHQTSAPPTAEQRDEFQSIDASAVPGVNARDFHDYVQRWFSTAECTVSNLFGKEQRRAAMAVAGLVVVALNLDALQLARDLYHDRALSERLAGRVDELVALGRTLTDKPPEGTPPASMDELRVALEKTTAVLSIEQVPIGWQNSYIAKRWCAYHDDCADVTVLTPTARQLFTDILVWMIGLFAAWLLLSLGAPFWVGVLSNAAGLINMLQTGKGDEHATETTAWSNEHQGRARDSG